MNGPAPVADRVRIVLVGTTHPGNIGAAARAMKTMCLSSLWLVAPQCVINDEARALSSGALDVLAGARQVGTLDDALAGCSLVIGTTARARTLDLPELAPRAAAAHVGAEVAQGRAAAVVFGPERTGLDNDALDRCQHRLTIPANPDYSSLNLAQAVQVVAYEVLLALGAAPPPVPAPEAAPASADEMERFYAHLEQALIGSRFLNPDNPRHLMRRLRRLFNRARPDQNEINILRGALASLQNPRNV